MTEKFNLANADRVGKGYLIESLMVNNGQSHVDATASVEGVLEAIVTALRHGVTVSLSNIGTLRPVAQPPRRARNPQTGGTVDVPARDTVRWKISPTLKAALNGETDRVNLATKAPKGSL